METFSRGNSISIWTIPKMALAVFIVFYLISILLYLQSSVSTSPFNSVSIWEGYLCDLIEPSPSGQTINLARPFAIVALWSICFGLLFLWRNVMVKSRPNNIWYQKVWHRFGLFAIFLMLLLPFGNHDRIILYSGISGMVSVLFLCFDLKQGGHLEQFLAGLLFLAALTFNNLFYLFDLWVTILPLIQKVTLLLFIVWYVLLDRSTTQ